MSHKARLAKKARRRLKNPHIHFSEWAFFTTLPEPLPVVNTPGTEWCHLSIEGDDYKRIKAAGPDFFIDKVQEHLTQVIADNLFTRAMQRFVPWYT